MGRRDSLNPRAVYGEGINSGAPSFKIIQICPTALKICTVVEQVILKKMRNTAIAIFYFQCLFLEQFKMAAI